MISVRPRLTLKPHIRGQTLVNGLDLMSVELAFSPKPQSTQHVDMVNATSLLNRDAQGIVLAIFKTKGYDLQRLCFIFREVLGTTLIEPLSQYLEARHLKRDSPRRDTTGHDAPRRDTLKKNTASERDASPKHWNWQNGPFTKIGQKWNRRSVGATSARLASTTVGVVSSTY
ncbi:unnamed protein product [Ilex paraguariensis]|uniref:Uncharacterized protein n=1 Tax=Ilex paraguariensis TaxID=185542 RepID=A0ABC8RRW5_9AQUA